MNVVYKNITEFVDVLNGCGVPYLILRNYENLFDSGICVTGHEDIDILTSNGRLLASSIGAKVFIDKVKAVCNDGVHYYIVIDGQEIELDIRSVGDGYYCSEWQCDMLKRRIMVNGCYVMDKYDYLYSLIYHSILQKRYFSYEYRQRLKKMCDSLNIVLTDDSISGFIRLLEKYLREHNYCYTYPQDIFVPLKTGYIDKSLLQKNISLAFKHWQFDSKVRLLELLVKIKHFLIR